MPARGVVRNMKGGRQKAALNAGNSVIARTFEPGDFVTSSSGESGLVLSPRSLAEAARRLPKAGRPGHFFAPGCCPKPDYVTQVPVLFADGSYDVMRATHLKKDRDPSIETRARLLRLLESIPNP